MCAFLKTTIVSPASIRINDDSDRNQFTILFQCSGQLGIKENVKIRVYPVLVKDELDSKNALCTEEEAQNTSFDFIYGPPKATMRWSYSADNDGDRPFFIVSIPKCPDAEWSLCFRSNGFRTTADSGAATLSIQLDVLTVFAPPAELLKYQTPTITNFNGPKLNVNLGIPYTISWETSLTDCCYLDGKPVSLNGEETYIATKPTTHLLYASGLFGNFDQKKVTLLISPPVINKFESDKSYFKSGEKIQLSWDVASVNSVFIEPGIGLVSSSGKIDIAPIDSAAYVLFANGYKDMEVCSVSKSLSVKETGWRPMGVCGGTKPGFATSYNCHIWNFDNNYYLFSDNSIFQSKDMLQWKKFAEAPVQAAEVQCSTCIYKKQFYIAQHLTNNEITIFSLDLAQYSWDPTYQIPYNGTAGRICSINNQLAYFGIEKSMLKYINAVNGSVIATWHDIGEDVMDVICLSDYAYLAIKDKTNIIIYAGQITSEDFVFKVLEVIPDGAANSKWFRLIVRNNNLYFASEQVFAKVTCWQSASKNNPYMQANQTPWLGGCEEKILFMGDREVWTF